MLKGSVVYERKAQQSESWADSHRGKLLIVLLIHHLFKLWPITYLLTPFIYEWMSFFEGALVMHKSVSLTQD